MDGGLCAAGAASGGSEFLREQRVVLMQGLHEALQVFERAGVLDHIVRGVEALLAARLCSQDLLGPLPAGAVARLQTLDLSFLGTVDDEHAVICLGPSSLHEHRYD